MNKQPDAQREGCGAGCKNSRTTIHQGAACSGKAPSAPQRATTPRTSSQRAVRAQGNFAGEVHVVLLFTEKEPISSPLLSTDPPSLPKPPTPPRPGSDPITPRGWSSSVPRVEREPPGAHGPAGPLPDHHPDLYGHPRPELPAVARNGGYHNGAERAAEEAAGIRPGPHGGEGATNGAPAGRDAADAGEGRVRR